MSRQSLIFSKAPMLPGFDQEVVCADGDLYPTDLGEIALDLVWNPMVRNATPSMTVGPPTAPFEVPTLNGATENVSRRVPIVAPQDQAADIRTSLIGQSFDSAVSVVVCSGSRVLGMVRMEDLLSAPGDVTAADLMDDSPPTLTQGSDLEAVAWKAVHHGESAILVVDNQRQFVGLIPPDKLLTSLLAEHDEDMARLGGFLRVASSARRASREVVLLRLWHRLPWLMLGLAGAFLAADLVSTFERLLEENVILAFFLPGIVYMADAVGTQTETIVVRGLSVGVPIGEVLKRELLTGFLVGIAIPSVFVPLAIWRWGESEVVVVVALSLFTACSIATLVAMTLPWLLHRLAKDPAFGSGPLATVVQDLLSVLIYFTIAVVVI